MLEYKVEDIFQDVPDDKKVIMTYSRRNYGETRMDRRNKNKSEMGDLQRYH